MESQLAEALIQAGALKEGTEVEARYLTVGLSGATNVVATDEFTIQSAFKTTDGRIAFKLASIRDGSKRSALAEAIIGVDGMDPIRFASVYNIKADGGAAVQGKRRGRKPKDRSKVV